MLPSNRAAADARKYVGMSLMVLPIGVVEYWLKHV
jgi:hypothetical protein